MPNPLDNVLCPDTAPTAATTIQDVFESNGGNFDVQAQDAFFQLQFGQQGTAEWGLVLRARPGSGIIPSGATGIRFWNAVAGQIARVSAVIFPSAHPAAFTNATASAATAPSTMLTGIIASNGTTTAGAGFTSSRTGAGIYVITFTTAFAAPPVVLALAFITAGTERLIDLAAAPTAAGFTVHTLNAAGAPTDADWNFIATAVV